MNKDEDLAASWRARRPSAAPEIGQHTREILHELGYDNGDVEAIMRKPA